ncbi:plastocyanin/azurin family copper-binding protein [Isoptericola sp. S6320L]|uniref:OmpL47-type beta-barrel domain-containing protein n=1 Tax=Isoptericola sp. S6320L TaxID=2926411 RepID=UPI001FF5396C|nr:plastocyanin/azurin family copper-binding protein [Isoptericola sp. S6320L]MCK0116106.1 plastocyanin/azurin family copper-binding protein [Isoptericola sp. S6320L]
MDRRTARPRGAGRLAAAVVTALTAATVVAAPAAAAPPPTSPVPPSALAAAADAPSAEAAAEQTLTWTAGNSISDYLTFPTTATAGPATIVFENSQDTGNTIGMSHTLTFDTTTEGYNHDLDLDILASPFDANGGLYEVEVDLQPGTYRYFCAIPGHGAMAGELVVTEDGGGGGDDTTAPAVSAEVTGDQDDDGAYVDGATVTLAATDDGSGVAGVEYDLDGAGWQGYDEPFVVDAVGTHTVEFRATDEAGNTSEPQSIDFTVVEGDGGGDVTAPTVTAEVAGEQDDDGAYVGSATLSLAATDDEAGSGVASIEYDAHGHWMPYTTPVEFTEPGEQTVSYRATDEAGNVSEVGTTSFTVVEGDGGGDDTTAPTVATELSGEQDDDGAYVGSASAVLTATDAGSGVETVEYDLDGAGWTEYTEAVVVDEPGEHELVARATDAAGNVSPESVTTFTVVAGDGGGDTVAPVVEPEVSGEQDADGAYLGSAAVALTASDDGSGVESVEYDLDGAGWTGYTEALVLDEPGEHTVSYRATDAAGNVSEVGSVTVTVVAAEPGDTEAPTVEHAVYGARNDAGEYVGSASITLDATDDDSGVASVEYQLDGGTWYRYASRLTVPTPGEHTLSYRATDVAGNVSAPGTVTFTVASDVPEDTVAPEVTASVSGERDARGSFVGRATVTLAASDEGSGVDRTEFQVDGGTWQRYAAPFVVGSDGDHVVRYRATDGAGNASRTGGVVFTVVARDGDRCVGSDVRPTVVIDGNDSTVANVDTGDGCTVNDVIAEDDDYRTHRAFLRHVKQVTRDLVQDKVLKPVERRRIIMAAELSSIGR